MWKRNWQRILKELDIEINNDFGVFLHRLLNRKNK